MSCLLNPDAVLQSGLEALSEACDLPGSAGAGGRLLDAGRTVAGRFMVRQLPTPATLILEAILLNRIWPDNPVNRRLPRFGTGLLHALGGGATGGAFLMVRRAVWRNWVDSTKVSFRCGSRTWIFAAGGRIGGTICIMSPKRWRNTPGRIPSGG